MDTLRPTAFGETGVFTKREQEKYVIKVRIPKGLRVDDFNNRIITPETKKTKMTYRNPIKLQTIKK